MSKQLSKAAAPSILESGIAATPSGKEYYRVVVRSQEPIPHSSDKPVARISKANYSPVAPSNQR